MTDAIPKSPSPPPPRRASPRSPRARASRAILRLSVDGGGCAGFQYRFGLADEVEADDLAAAQDGVTLVVDPISLDLVRGSAVDYRRIARRRRLPGHQSQRRLRLRLRHELLGLIIRQLESVTPPSVRSLDDER